MATDKEIFDKMNTTKEMASGMDNETLGGLTILSAVFTEFCLAEIICAEANKINSAVGWYYGNNASNVNSSNYYNRLEQLARLDDSVGNVLDKVCCVEGQINKKIEQGRAIRTGRK